jgi:copper ion binding protein
MTCAACVGHVERALTEVEGVSGATVSLLASQAKVTFDPAVTNAAALQAAVEEAGYEVPKPSAATTLQIRGMTCAACVGHVERALTQVEGVSGATVSLLANQAKVTFDPAVTNTAALQAAVEEAGYEVPKVNAATTLQIKGMTCAACVGHVERALNQVDGVKTATVSLLANEAKVTFDPTKTNLAALKSAIHEAGYEASDAPMNLAVAAL